MRANEFAEVKELNIYGGLGFQEFWSEGYRDISVEHIRELYYILGYTNKYILKKDWQSAYQFL